MDLQEMKRLVEDAVGDADLRPEDIPSIDLYLDQITSLASGKLREGSPRFYDRVLTKTMINNYSKDGLLSPINGKKYSKEHFLQMLLVYALKNTLSIGEIKRILQNIYRMPDYEAERLCAVYNRFLDIKQDLRDRAWDFTEHFYQTEHLNPDNEQDFFLLLLGLSAMSSYLKNTVQALLEAHYPDLNAERERAERERKEELRRAKEEKKKAAKKKADEPNARAGAGAKPPANASRARTASPEAAEGAAALQSSADAESARSSNAASAAGEDAAAGSDSAGARSGSSRSESGVGSGSSGSDQGNGSTASSPSAPDAEPEADV